jgi:hypothetical protein
MENITRYIGLILIVLAAIIMISGYAIYGSPPNEFLAISSIMGIIGLLVQVFVGRAAD